MPNILNALARGITSPFPRRMRPEDLIMDRNGITGQELREEITDPSAEDPSMAPSGLPSGMPQRPALSSPSPSPTQELDPLSYIRQIATNDTQRPQMPKAPSGWRAALATIAGSTRGGQAFAPLIAYGPKGLRQMSEVERYDSTLPQKIQIGNAWVNAQNADTNERWRRDQQTALDEQRRQTEVDRFTSPTVGGTWASNLPLKTEINTQSTQVETPSMGLDKMTPPSGNPTLPQSVRNRFTPQGVSELPPPIQLDPVQLPGSSMGMTGREGTPTGYRDVPTPKNELARGERRIQPSRGELTRQDYIAKTEVTPAFIKERYEGMPDRLPATSIQAYMQAVESGNRAEADRIARAEQAEAARTNTATIAKENRESREQIAADNANLRRDLSTGGVNINIGTPTPTGPDGKPRKLAIEDAPSGLRSQIQQVLDYKAKNPPNTRNNAVNQQIRKWVADLDPDYDEKDFDNRKKIQLDYGPSGTTGKQLTSVDTALSHLDAVREAGEALKSNQVQVLNKIATAWGAQTGTSAPVVYDAIVEIVAPELVKAIVGSGATGGVTDRAEMKKVLDRNLSPEQRSGTIGGMSKLMEARFNTQAKAYEDAMKRPLPRKLSPKSQAHLDRYSGGPGAGDRVKVKNVKGDEGTIPRSQLQQALAEGYTEVK